MPEGRNLHRPRGDGWNICVRAVAALALAVIYATVSHRASAGLDTVHVTLPVPELPQALSGLRIAQITDLHSSRFGPDQRDLVNAIKAFKPDIIAVTGDFIDGGSQDFEPCEELIRRVTLIAPVYWVRGNHEYYLDTDKRIAFEMDMERLGAHLLSNQAVTLQRNGEQYLLAGLDDIHEKVEESQVGLFQLDEYGMKVSYDFMNELNRNTPAGNYPFKLLLCHRPAYWRPWREAGYQVALCGHLHGWMARLPGVGGVMRMPSRFFPTEDAGLYDLDGMQVYISRGLNNQLSLKNFRMNNKPELTLIKITGKLG